MELAALKNEIATACTESAYIEFKTRFDANDKRAWCEIVKDILALANSGGGCIVFGLDSDGSHAGIEPTGFENIDPATIANKVSAYLTRQFTEFRIEMFERNGRTYPGLMIEGVPIPLVPKQNGHYAIGNNKNESAFTQGSIYFRHNAKSEIAEQADIDRVVRAAEEGARVKFATEIQNVARLPDGYTVQAVPSNITVSIPKVAETVRITDDLSAPGVVPVDMYKIYPHGQKELIKLLGTRVPECRANSRDILCIRKAFASEIQAKSYVWLPPRNSPQYKNEFAEWIVSMIGEDPDFLAKTRAKCKPDLVV